jgi:hypothetical protein
MSFDLARTPTLQAVATQDEQMLAQDLQTRADESVAQAAAEPEVVEALEAHRAAQERLNRLRRAERLLTQSAKESREQMDAVSQTVLDLLIESAASGGKPEFKKLKELGAIEDQYRFSSRAIQRIVERLIPRAHIEALREESHALEAQARAIELLAQDRAEKVLAQLRDAVTEEVVLPVDLSKGVAGVLLSRAATLKRQAVQISENADQMERSYADRETNHEHEG